MNPQELYRRRLISIPDAVSMVQPHHVIGTAMAASEPVGLLTELGNHKERLENVTTWVCLPLREYAFVHDPGMAGRVFVENWFYGAPDRKVHPQGRISYIPNNLHAAARVKLKAANQRLDVFWGTATPPDKRGFMSLSLGLVIEKQLIEAADLVILEINEKLPWTLGDTQIHVSEVDFLVEHHAPLFELPIPPIEDWQRSIGGHIAELIEDGATLQLGIGGIPNAITAFLLERRDLGIHTEMFTDGMVDLYEAGVVTGRHKTLWKGKMVGAFALGTQKLYDFVDNNLVVEFQQGRVTNNPTVIGKNHKMVSVNTALQVDLYGQVCSQSIGPRHYSGTGGQLDTHRGAQMSPGGRGIIALRSTAKGGTISTIVPVLSEGAEVTIPSQEIDTVVTEYGMAELCGLPVKDRMEALIKIAHPDFRDWLRDEADRLGIVPRVTVQGVSLEKPARKATAPGVTADTITLGTFCDLSGPNATIGMAALRGYSAYYDHVNRWGGVHGRKINLVVKDDSFDPSRTRIAAMQLVMDEHVFAIVHPLGTSTNLAAMPYLLEKEIPVIAPHSGVSTWADPVKHTYFALQPSYDIDGRILAQHVLDAYGDPGRVAVFVVEDQFGDEGSSAFIDELKRAGIEPVVTVTHKIGHGAAQDWLEELSTYEPDIVLLYTYVKPAADLLRAAHGAGFCPQWLGTYVISGPDLLQLAGAEATHGLRTTSYPTGPQHARGERLYRKQMARDYADETPGTHSRIGYAAAQLVVEGLRRAGPDLTREGFIKALTNLQEWSGGLLPTVSYSATDRRGLKTLAIQRAINGKWILEQRLVKLRP